MVIAKLAPYIGNICLEMEPPLQFLFGIQLFYFRTRLFYFRIWPFFRQALRRTTPWNPWTVDPLRAGVTLGVVLVLLLLVVFVRCRMLPALAAETLRAALNQVATVAPQWLRSVVPPQWYERYSRRIEETRLPKGEAQREAYARTVGQDGCTLLKALQAADLPQGLDQLPIIETLRRTWQRHYKGRENAPTASSDGESSQERVRFKAKRELPRAAEGIE